jgi:hypothetical protein
VTGSEFGGSSSERAVNSDHVRADRGEEVVDHRVGSMLQRPHDDLCVHGGGDQNVIAARQVRYRNAAAIAHSTLTTPGASNLDGSIGAENGRSDFPHGAVDELAIYTTGLSAPTLTLHYNLAEYPSG